jgi:hypothetical protein
MSSPGIGLRDKNAIDVQRRHVPMSVPHEDHIDTWNLFRYLNGVVLMRHLTGTHFTGPEVEVAVRILIELIDQSVVHRAKRVELRRPHDGIGPFEIERMRNLEVGDVVNRRKEADLEQTFEMGVPESQATEQQIAAKAERGVLFLRTIGNADRIAHVSACLVHGQSLHQAGRQL